MAGYKPLFSEEFLRDRLAAFELSSVVNIAQIRKTIKNLNESLESGKLDAMKEEAIKSRFLMELFGDVLGFNYKNPNKWLFEEEVKTGVDGTKPDGALGSFYITETGVKRDVRVVIEAKDAGTNLDDIQKDRPAKITPVDQAMIYATKMGINCRWVIVTNIRELRFYQANDQTCHQKFHLTELLQENHLRELLCLFLRENFYTGQESSTDGLLRLVRKEQFVQPIAGHIVDQLYHSLKRFDQLYFTDPKLIANMKPFNILEEHVWHYSERYLFSLNQNIFELLKAISVEEGEVQIDPAYETQMRDAGVLEYTRKINYILEKLHHSQVSHWSALANLDAEKKKNKNTIGFTYRHMMHLTDTNSVTLKITDKPKEECDCLACTYHSLDFGKLISKLESLEEGDEPNTLEIGYGHYLLCTDNFKKSYRVYKNIEREAKGDEKRLLEYFLVKYNIKHLHNLFFDDPEYRVMRKDARSIDLERVVSNELDLYCDSDLRKVLLEIKDDRLFTQAEKNAEKLLKELKDVRSFMARGGTYNSLPNYVQQLYLEFTQVFAYVQKNYLVYDKFTNYKKFIGTIFHGLVISSRTPKHGIDNLGVVMLTEAVLHIQPKELQRILKPVKTLKVKNKDRIEFLGRATTFFSSYSKETIFGKPIPDGLIEKQLMNSIFSDQYTNIFSNLCSILSLMDCTAEEFNDTAKAMINFIKVDGTLAWWDVEQLGILIENKGSLFSSAQLTDLLKFALDKHRLYETNKYEGLIRQVCKGIKTFHPDTFFDNSHITKRAILNCQCDDGRYDLTPLIPLWQIATEPVKVLLTRSFEEALDDRFNDHLYELLLKSRVISYDRKDYFQQLAELTNRQKGTGFKGFEDGQPKFNNFVSFNFLLIPYVLGLPYDLPEMKVLTGLSDFEQWLADPDQFSYDHFDARWLIASSNPYILKRLKGHQMIKEKTAEFLKNNYDKQLSKIYFKYFA